MHLSISIITILAHVSLLLSLSFFIQAEDLSAPFPRLKNKFDDDTGTFPKHSCSGKQLFCWKDGHDGPKGKKIMRCCNHRCVNIGSDVENCGFCGKICPFPQQCCKGFCVDTNNSRFNCGRCGNKCRFHVHCVYGMCGYGQPDPPQPPKGRWKPPHPLKDRHRPPPVDTWSSSFI